MAAYSEYIWSVPLIYFISFLILVSMGKGFKNAGIFISLFASLASFVLTILVFIERLRPHAVDYSYHFDWLRVGPSVFRIGYELTNLSTWMLLLLSFVHFVIQVFSYIYFYKNSKISTYYAYASLLVFAISGMILADSIFNFYLFWILISIALFMLLGFHQWKKEKKQGAVVVVAWSIIGQVSFLVVVLLLYTYMPDHSLEFATIQSVFGSYTEQIPQSINVLIGIGLLITASIQAGIFPFHQWLKRADLSAIPTAAYVYTLGTGFCAVYLLIRMIDVLEQLSILLNITTALGIVSVLVGSIAMLSHNGEHKRIFFLAMSQYGFLYTAIGLNGTTGALFQLFIWILSIMILIFLASITKKSLVKVGFYLPASFSLIGIPPLSGFWSQGWIVSRLYEKGMVMFIVCLILLLIHTLNVTIALREWWENGLEGIRESYSISNRLIWSLFLFPIVLLISLGFVGLLWSNEINDWFTEQMTAPFIQLVPTVCTFIVITAGACLGWICIGNENHPFMTSIVSAQQKVIQAIDFLCEVARKTGQFTVTIMDRGERVVEGLTISIIPKLWQVPAQWLSATTKSIWKMTGIILAIGLLVSGMVALIGGALS